MLSKAERKFLDDRPYRIERNDTGTLIFAHNDLKEARRKLKELRQTYKGRITFTKHGF